MAFDGTTSIEAVEISVSEFVALLNQSLEYVFPSVTLLGELANLRVSKGKWLYFDLKDEASSVKCFGTVYQLPGPLENGMLLKVTAQPRLHNLYGFSLNVSSIRPAGEGSIRRAADLLEAKLVAEGLFDPARKRAVPYPPRRIGLITSSESAAYADFMKIVQARWVGLAIELIDVQVQGEPSVGQVVAAIEQFNAQAEPPDVLVITRGGGSAEDLQAFSSEAVTRAVAASRVPTLVAIGHEIDTSLAELAADQRASTPSNAAELLVPDKVQVLRRLQDRQSTLVQEMQNVLRIALAQPADYRLVLTQLATQQIYQRQQSLQATKQLLEVLSPEAVLRRGYVMIRKDNRVVRRAKDLTKNDTIELRFSDGRVIATVQNMKKGKTV
jgi:exodeoxyribonuclease VII large subunit